jgi:hypothetical protein
MKNYITNIVVAALLLCSQVYAGGVHDELIPDAKRFGGPYGLIIMVDNSGLNNQNSCPTLANKNLENMKSLISKDTMRQNRLSSVEFVGFNENIVSIKSIQESRPAKLFRISQDAVSGVEEFLYKDTSSASKDIFSSLRYINRLVRSKYSGYETVAISIYTNLRQSVSSGKDFKDIEPIIMDHRIRLKIMAASGLECQGAVSSELFHSEQNSVDFWKSKIVSNNLEIITVY